MNRAAEADRVEQLYHWAMIRVGAGAFADALALFKQTRPRTGIPGSVSTYLAAAKKLVKLRRVWLIDVTVTYYRLVRVLRTGSTIAVPGYDPHPSVESLRQDFERAVQEVANHSGSSPIITVPKKPTLPAANPEDDKPVDIDELDADWQKILAELEAEAEAEAERFITLGADALEKKYSGISPDTPTDVADKARDDATNSAARRSAAVAERISKQAARGLAYRLSDYDGKVMGWARYSTSGTPCGFCAMLISRGPVYKTAESAGGLNDYHDHCNCRAVPVFSKEQYHTSDLFALNRQYADEWGAMMRSHTGKEDVMTTWRRKFRQNEKKKPAQAAA